MAKKNRKRKLPAPLRGVLGDPQESRRAEVATIAWMLMFVVTVLTEVAAIAAALVAHFTAAERDSPLVAGFIPLMLFSGAVSGILGLALLPLVYRFRRLKPPTVITALAAAVSAGAIVALATWPLVG